MNYKIVDTSKIVEELMEVLVKNQVPVKALDNLLEELKNHAYIHTIIQSDKAKEEMAQEIPAQEPSVKRIDLSQVSINDLVNELVKRKDCVTELRPEPYEKYSISMEYNGTITDLGPATILKIID
ncbi:TPA: BC1881 family protein [Clostridium sporogenes]